MAEALVPVVMMREDSAYSAPDKRWTLVLDLYNRFGFRRR